MDILCEYFLVAYRRRQRRSGVELTSSTTVTQYSDSDNGGAAAFNNRYRKAWDNLQLDNETGGKSGVEAGKDTPISQTTFKSTGPRRRDENPLSTQSEMVLTPSHAGTLKSVGGLSEAYHGSEEILVDDSTIPQMHEHNLTVLNTGNGPGKYPCLSRVRYWVDRWFVNIGFVECVGRGKER